MKEAIDRGGAIRIPLLWGGVNKTKQGQKVSEKGGIAKEVSRTSEPDGLGIDLLKPTCVVREGWSNQWGLTHRKGVRGIRSISIS